MDATLTITEITGKIWELNLSLDKIYSIGRAKDNQVVLNDQRVSRYHAYLQRDGLNFKLIDGCLRNGGIQRSINRVFVNGIPFPERILHNGDRITIGASQMIFTKNLSESQSFRQEEIPEFPAKIPAPIKSDKVKYDDNPLGHTQLLISASEIIGKNTNLSTDTVFATPQEIKDLRRKARALELLYDLSKTLGTVFDLKEIFVKATDLIFRGTPSERVVALIAEEGKDGKISDDNLNPIAVKVRDEKLGNLSKKLTISRTITQKVMQDKVALLSQDARSDEQFQNSESIVSQGVRSTICAPLITESGVHGVIYADRLDPFASFSSDDLELISAVAAQTAMVIETVKAHKRLAREEVARVNYSRFMPEYVVRQLLENPDSFRLGGINQTITILFADIRGFTTLSENENPERVVGLLNRYFSSMSEIIFAHGGTLDKYIGDGLMAIFGAPTATADDAKNAVKTAIEMQKKLISLNSELQAEGYKPIGIGIGLHTGEATVGYIGSDKRSEYTAIGDTVNLSARLEQNSKPGQILISEATVRACEGENLSLIPHNPLKVKNRVQPVSLFEVKWN